MTNEITPEPTTEDQVVSPLSMSAGAGIAIVGIWIAAAALTGLLFWGIWISDSFTEVDLVDPNDPGFWQWVNAFFILIVIIWLIASPMITATKITRLIIIGKK